MPRIPYPDPENLSDAKRAALAGAPHMLNIAKMLMHAPDPFWAPMRALGFATIRDTTIPDALRELLILRVAYLARSEYELFHHEAIAAAIGLPPEKCAAMRTGDYAALDDAERTIARFVTELVERTAPSDETLAAARGLFDDATLFEMILLVGNYWTLSRVAAVSGVEKDAAPVTGWAGR